jgi:histone H2A
MANPKTSFASFAYRVLKQVHPDTGMTGDALAEINNLTRISLEKFVEAANNLLLSNKSKKTITSLEIQVAVRLVLPGELAKHAVSEGTKAVTRYNASVEDPKTKTKGGAKKVPTSRAHRAGLQFPVTRVENMMMKLCVVNRKSSSAAVYLSAVLEYLTAEILELAGNASRDYKKHRINTRHIKLAVGNDEELSRFYHDTIMSGGVLPHIQQQIIPDPAKKRPRAKKAASTKKVPTAKKTLATKKGVKKAPATKKSAPKKPATKKAGSKGKK